MMRESRTLSAVAKKALLSSNFSGEKGLVNSAWNLMLEAIDAESGTNSLKVSASVIKERIIN